jgi:hypothetical protein
LRYHLQSIHRIAMTTVRASNLKPGVQDNGCQPTSSWKHWADFHRLIFGELEGGDTWGYHSRNMELYFVLLDKFNVGVVLALYEGVTYENVTLSLTMLTSLTA